MDRQMDTWKKEDGLMVGQAEGDKNKHSNTLTNQQTVYFNVLAALATTVAPLTYCHILYLLYHISIMLRYQTKHAHVKSVHFKNRCLIAFIKYVL